MTKEQLAVLNAELSEINRFNQAEAYPGALLVYEAHGDETILFANNALIELFECENLADFMEYTGSSFRNIVHPEDLERVEDSIWRQIRSKQKMPKGSVKYFDDYVDYRIITKSGRILKVEDTGRLVTNNKYGDIFYVFITDREQRKSQIDFQTFLENSRYESTDTSAPGYRGYIIWDLTSNEPFVEQSGVGFIPENLKDGYTYDAHYDLMTSFMGSDDSRNEAQRKHTRAKLLDDFAEGRKTEPLIANYNVRGTWSRIRSDFSMMRNPDTGHIYLKVQNRNDVPLDVYGDMFESTVKEIFDSILYFDFEKDGLLVADNLTNENMRRSQQLISKCLHEVYERIDILADSKDELEAVLSERVENPEQRKWTFERPGGRYYHVKARKAGGSKSAYAAGIIDVTEEIMTTMERDRQDYRNKAMLAALAVEYVTITELDMSTGRISAFKLDGYAMPQVKEAVKTGNYDFVREVMCNTSIDPQYRDEFARLTDTSVIRQRLREVPNYSYVFKTTFDTYVEVKIVRAEESTEGVPEHVIIAFADKDQVTREKLASERDRLTGLYNRSVYEKKLTEIREEKHKSVCVAIMDLNGLKYVNDNLGHMEGDALLKGAAHSIRDAFGDMGPVFRIGGDEFAAIILDQNHSEQELRDRLKACTEKWKGTYSERLAISVGIACCTAASENQKALDDIIREADAEMYADKRLYYSQKGNDRRKDRGNITKNELANRIAELRTMFDVVRVVDIDKKRAIGYDEKGQEYFEHRHCFEIWGRSDKCQNCISARAMKDHGKHSKFEFKEDGIYMASSKYVSVDGRPALIEVVNRLEDTSLFDVLGDVNVEKLINKSNERACEMFD